MKLNIGAGSRRIDGYVGVDVDSTPAADLIAPATTIPLEDGCAEELMAIHLIEHLFPWDVPDALAEWARLLKRGGLLVIEAPDLYKACRNILDGRQGSKHPDQLGLWALYGDPRLQNRLMAHQWAYSFKTLAPMVSAAGFVSIVECPTQFHIVGRGVRDFRLEARRG